MDDGLIHDVSDTAFMVATYRAMETERPDALFRDPLADKLSGIRGRKIVERLTKRSSLGQWFVAIRTCIIDALIESALAEGTDTVLNLGAGLDTRPYRMNLPHDLRWIEVDYPSIIELKEDRLSENTPRCRLERVRLDLADAVQRRELLARIAAESERALVLTEGVVPYLSTDEVALLADDLNALHAFCYWIVDYFSPLMLRYRKWMTPLRMRRSMQNAPFRFEPDDYFPFFRRHGWAAKQTRYITEEAKKLDRLPPRSLAFRLSLKLMRALTPPSRRDALGKSFAYVLLEPATPR
jgi:methyltransferase (TIGR00027 family)